MPRWLYGSVLVVYLAGTFGFGLLHQISGDSPNVAEAMRFGATWPWLMLHMLNLV